MSDLNLEESAFGPLFEYVNAAYGENTRQLGSVERIRAPRMVDLFCGCGGLTLGLVRAGFNCVKAFDIWYPAVATYHRNISYDVELFDLADSPEIPDCEVIVGGPPCQGFSSAGRRNRADNRNSLVGVFATIVANHRPKAFIFENVEGFLTAGRGRYVQELLDPLVAAGYIIHLRKINAANFGVPQHRKRVIAIGGLGFDPGFPVWTHWAFGIPGAHLAAYGLPLSPTLGETIMVLPPPTTEPPGLVEDHWYQPLNHDDAERASLLEPGQRMRDLPEHLWHASYRRRSMRRVMDGTPVEKRGGPPAGLRRLDADEPSKAITSGSLRDYIHPWENRPLTVREAAKIQTFPDWFDFEGSTSDKMQMIANAVPVDLATAIGRSLMDIIPCEGPVVNGHGELRSFVPTSSKGMSPALSETCQLIKSKFGIASWKSDQRLR